MKKIKNIILIVILSFMLSHCCWNVNYRYYDSKKQKCATTCCDTCIDINRIP